MTSFLELANERYSVRQLSDKPIEQDKIDKIIKSGMAAPTAVNFQPAKIWVIQSAEAKEKLVQTTRFDFVQQAPVSFVIGADTNNAWVRKYDGKNFAEVDASIIATHMMLEIHDLGLGTTWVGHFDPNKMTEFFPEMSGYSLIAILPVGYPTDNAEPARKHYESKSLDEMVTVI